MMKSVEIRIRVTPQGQLILPPQPDIEPGEYNAVLVIEAETPKTKRAPLNLPVVDLGPWPEDLSLQREDLYDDKP
ncbi:MAG: hypothetical protein HZC41_02990 [Chloroflexi bacterium]|nr:hypothetical protein [Chloroflexota bacterium]